MEMKAGGSSVTLRHLRQAWLMQMQLTKLHHVQENNIRFVWFCGILVTAFDGDSETLTNLPARRRISVQFLRPLAIAPVESCS
mmetsp:Transcript_44290/g.73494  ORF Transcript_44290/g.73494 Transcript_44290/m.73494 type:complete len:83 (+) Transcript_44290:629-877(+)